MSPILCEVLFLLGCCGPVPAANLPPDIQVSVTPETVTSIPAPVDYQLTGDDPDGTITDLYWSFGDGGHRLDAAGQYTYVSPGTYEVTVRAKDDQGAVSTASTSVTISDPAYPELTVVSPAEDPFATDQDTLDLVGQTTGAATVHWSTDRGEAGQAAGLETFTATAPLHPGRNRVLINAYGPDGRMTSAERAVFYDPLGPMTIESVVLQTPAPQRWEPVVITFDVENSCATEPAWPYETQVPPFVTPELGITVNGEFSDDGFATVLVQPAFLYQPYLYADLNNKDWLYPDGPARWMLRFAPPRAGLWQYRITASDACGSAASPAGSFTAADPDDPNNHGFVRVNPNDTRYFRFDDGSHFVGVGHNDTYVDVKTFMRSMRSRHQRIGSESADFFRIWTLGSCVAGSGHPPLLSATLPYRGYLPAEGLSAKQAYADGDVSVELNADNPCMFYGWLGGDTALEAGHIYRVRVRVKLIEVTGPKQTGYAFGFTVKRTGWPDPPDFFPNKAPIVQHRAGSMDWAVLEGDFTSSGDYLGYLSLVLENTTGGAAYIDEISIRELLSDGRCGPELNRRSRMNYHRYFCNLTSYQFDDLLERSRQQGLYYRIVLSEKDDYVLGRLGSGGFMEKNGSPKNFNAVAGTAGYTWQSYWWRYATARWAACRSLHSWELANEQNPADARGYRHAQEMAAWFHLNDPHRHDAVTSFWSGFPEQFWAGTLYPDVLHADVHAYLYYDTPENGDTAYGHWLLGRDLAGRVDKPVIRGETGILGPAAHGGGEDADLKLDTQGIWLHNLAWAQLDYNGMYELYWYPANIRGEGVGHADLYGVYRPFRRFMADVPLGNGNYADAAATSSDPKVRVVGQFDSTNQRGHLWIQHADHTWRNVVAGVPVTPLDARIDWPVVGPRGKYRLTWFNTYDGTETDQILAGSPDGILALQVAGLSTDVAVKAECIGQAVPGDMDFDGDVDQTDFGAFQACYSGAGIAAAAECAAARLDQDSDVDPDDFTAFRHCWSGPDLPADPACLDSTLN